MIKNFFSLWNVDIYRNLYFKRLKRIYRSIITFIITSLIDIYVITFISKNFNAIISASNLTNLVIKIIMILFLVVVRTISIYLLKKYSFNLIFKKKNKDELQIINHFIIHRVSNFRDNQALESLKESLINSSNLAAVNFDLPICSIISELIFAAGGLIIMIRLLGLDIILFNFPIFIFLLVFSKLISGKLKTIGNNIVNFTEKRLTTIDNISENSYELSVLKTNKKATYYFNKINYPYNKTLGSHLIISSAMQLLTESTSFVVILISLISIKFNLLGTDIVSTATVLAVLSRMVPSITRTIASITQLQYGIPCVKKLYSQCPSLN